MAPHESTPREFRHSWFAVWHWPRWTWAVVILANTAYLISPFPVAYVMLRCGMEGETVGDVLRSFYAPILWVDEYSSEVQAFHDWQFEMLKAAFGPIP